MRPIVTLLTDFGDQSGYVAQLKASILSNCRDAVLVDISHSIAPQDIAGAAWLLRDVIEAFPPDTIHVVVVDPGVGSSRRIIAMETSHGSYVAPDNGVLTLVARDLPRQSLVELNEPRYWRSTVSSTFHGRDIIGPIAGHRAAGVPVSAMGSPITTLQTLRLPQVVMNGFEIDGVVIRIDAFGNLITNISAADLARVSDARRLNWECCGQHATAFVNTYAEGRVGELVVLIGSSGRLEFSIVNGNASHIVGASVGAAVRGRPVHVF